MSDSATGRRCRNLKVMTRRLASDERGFALVLAIVTMLVLSSLTASVLFSVAENSTSAYRTNQSAKAFALAEEGIAYAEGRLYTATTPGNQNNVPHIVVSQDGGSIEYYGTLAGSTWTLYGKGTYAGITRTVQVQAPQPPPVVTIDTTPWNYFYVEGGPTCMTIAGNGSFNIPLYTHGSVCLNGNAKYTGSDLEIGGSMMSGITEGIVEEACLEYLRACGYSTLFGPEIGPGGAAEERAKWDDVVLIERLREAVARINPELNKDAVQAVLAAVLRAESQNPLAENYRVHRMITEGVAVEQRTNDGSIRHTLAWLIDFGDPSNNDWLAVNQFTVIEHSKNRRPDVVIL